MSILIIYLVDVGFNPVMGKHRRNGVNGDKNFM